MKWIKYQIAQCTIANETILAYKKIGYSEANLAIAQAEAYNGVYEIIEEDASHHNLVIDNGVSVPSYWVDTLRAGADAIRVAMENAGRNKSSFLFYSDAHWTGGAKVSPKLLRHLYHSTAINKVIFGGDIVDNEPTAETLSDRSIMEYLWDWRSQIKDLNHYSVVGNHDDGNATNNLFDYDYVYSYLFAPEDRPEIVRGGDTYYYFDDAREKTRYLMLDTGYEGLSTLSYSQVDFIEKSLISTPDKWHIIVVAHIWYMPDYDAYYNQGVRPMPIVGLSSSATHLVGILDEYNARVGKFINCHAKIEFCIGGHVHIDYDGVSDTGIPIILCETDCGHIRSGLPYKEGATNEASVSGIIADYADKKVTVARIGRGVDRVVDMSLNIVTNYYSITNKLTNVITSSTVTNVEEGKSFSTTFTVAEGGTLSSVKVMMGDEDITISAFDSSTNTITIGSVNGDVVITVKATLPNSGDSDDDEDDEGGSSGGNVSYTNVLDVVGYTKGIYLSGSGSEGADANVYTTGYIHCPAGSTVYLKNVTIPDASGHSNRVAGYDSDKNFISGTCYSLLSSTSGHEPVWDDNGNLIQFTWGHSGSEYIRITAGLIDDTSIITVNQPIV